MLNALNLFEVCSFNCHAHLLLLLVDRFVLFQMHSLASFEVTFRLN